MVSNPIDYNTGNAVNDMAVQLFANGWSQDGTTKTVPDFATGPLTTLSGTGSTTLSIEFKIPANSAAKVIAVGLGFDIQKTAARKGGLRVLSTSIVFTPEVISAGVQDDAKIRVAYPILNAANKGYESDPPMKGDVLYFGERISNNCATCKPISDGGYIRPVTGQGHVVTMLKQRSKIQEGHSGGRSTNSHWMILSPKRERMQSIPST